ncbi:MAG: hypothetical protein ABI847_15810, partial [Anaerolineales bacterium]
GHLATVPRPSTLASQDSLMDAKVQRYLDALPEDRRPLFNRLQDLILGLYPKAEVVIWVVRHAIEHFDDHLK